MNNKDINAASGRRRFLVRAGMGSLPVLMALKSKGAWGYTTQNCNLSAAMSQMQSSQAEQFETCASTFHSHGDAKEYFDVVKSSGHLKTASSERAGYFHSASDTYHHSGNNTYTYSGIEINESTLFSEIFAGGYGSTLARAVDAGPTPLIQDIAAIFLHSMFYRGQGMYPEPEVLVDSYNTAVFSGQTDQLAKVLKMYIDGENEF